MKKTIILLALAACSLTVAAQNRTVQSLADKYCDREGFSTTVIQGYIDTGNKGSIYMQGIDVSNIMKDIASIIIVSSDKPDPEFSADVKEVIAADGYSIVMSESANGEMIKFLLKTLPSGGGKSPANEFVIIVLGSDTNMVTSIVGNYKVKKISKTQE